MDTTSNRFTLGVDLDDVAADYRTEFVQFVTASGGPQLDAGAGWDFGYSGDDLGDWLAMFTEQRRYATLPVLRGADVALQAISDADIRIVIITHRLFRKGDHKLMATDTISWLDDYAKIPFWDFCMMRDKWRIGVDVMVEDAPHNLQSLVENGRDVIAMDQPYNRHLDYRRASHWGDVIDILMNEYGLDIDKPTHSEWV